MNRPSARNLQRTTTSEPVLQIQKGFHHRILRRALYFTVPPGPPHHCHSRLRYRGTIFFRPFDRPHSLTRSATFRTYALRLQASPIISMLSTRPTFRSLSNRHRHRPLIVMTHPTLIVCTVNTSMNWWHCLLKSMNRSVQRLNSMLIRSKNSMTNMPNSASSNPVKRC